MTEGELGPPCSACESRGVLCHLRRDPELPTRWVCPECGALVYPRRVALWSGLWVLLGLAAILTFERFYCG